MSKTNQRNYFRILYVQPDAPVEIVTASYRALMGPLKKHPDRGGDHAEASLINEAYNVLSDPVRREAYVRTYRHTWARNGPPAEPQKKPAWDPSAWARSGCCPFCRAKLPTTMDADAQCARCESPLVSPLKRESQKRELLGRRSGARTMKGDSAILYPSWGAHPVSARMRDISADGLSLYAGVTVPVGQPIRIAGALFDAVAVVVSSRARERVWLINARLLTVRYRHKAGVFVSVVA
ncbi:MAG: J domain-containing protein [Pseudomonadota bacterium]